MVKNILNTIDPMAFIRIILPILIICYNCGSVKEKPIIERTTLIKEFIMNDSILLKFNSINSISAFNESKVIIEDSSSNKRIYSLTRNDSIDISPKDSISTFFIECYRIFNLTGYKRRNVPKLGIGRTFYFGRDIGVFEIKNSGNKLNSNWLEFFRLSIDSIGEFKINILK